MKWATTSFSRSGSSWCFDDRPRLILDHEDLRACMMNSVPRIARTGRKYGLEIKEEVEEDMGRPRCKGEYESFV